MQPPSQTGRIVTHEVLELLLHASGLTGTWSDLGQTLTIPPGKLAVDLSSKNLYVIPDPSANADEVLLFSIAPGTPHSPHLVALATPRTGISGVPQDGHRGSIRTLRLCLGVAVPCMAKNSNTCGYNVSSVLHNSDGNNESFATLRWKQRTKRNTCATNSRALDSLPSKSNGNGAAAVEQRPVAI